MVILTNEQITDRREAEQPDAEMVQTYRAYASGNHREVLSTAQQKLLSQRSEHRMTDNIIDLIIKTTASRLKLTKWEVMDESPVSILDGSTIPKNDTKSARSWLNSLWLMNRMPRLQYETHYAQMRDTNSVISMAYRSGRVHLWREPWWDGETGIFIAYDDAGEYEFGVKEWKQREVNGDIIIRRSVYEPGLLSRWVQNGSGWKPFDTDNEPSEVPMLRRDNKPLPIPLVHFPNGTNVSDGYYGQSDIAALLALQDDLNATQLDISAAALMTAFQRIFLSGVEKQKKITMEPGGVFGDENPNARMTVVQAGDISQLTNVHTYKRESMSIVSRTPIHALTGQWPSGAALLRADMPIIEKVESLADVNGPQWTTVAHRAMELANAVGRLDLNENVPVTSIFAPAERIDELTDLEIKQARATLWDTLSRLPREAMLQSGLVDKDAADKILQERNEQRMSYITDLNSGAFGADYEESGE